MNAHLVWTSRAFRMAPQNQWDLYCTSSVLPFFCRRWIFAQDIPFAPQGPTLQQGYPSTGLGFQLNLVALMIVKEGRYVFIESCAGSAPRPKATRSDILLENCQRISKSNSQECHSHTFFSTYLLAQRRSSSNLWQACYTPSDRHSCYG